MLKKIAGVTLAASLLSGCQPAPPNPTAQAIAAQCQAGDQAACANYVNLQQVRSNGTTLGNLGLPQIGSALF